MIKFMDIDFFIDRSEIILLKKDIRGKKRGKKK